MFLVETYNRIISSEIFVEDCTAYVTDYTDWINETNKGTNYKFSPFTLPTNHSIELKFNSSTGTRIALGDTTHLNNSGYLEWIYAWYIDTRNMYYRSSTNAELTASRFHSSISSNSICRIEYDGTTLDIYINGSFNRSFTTYDVLGLTRLIRLNSNTVQNIDYIKVKPL